MCTTNRLTFILLILLFILFKNVKLQENRNDSTKILNQTDETSIDEIMTNSTSFPIAHIENATKYATIEYNKSIKSKNDSDAIQSSPIPHFEIPKPLIGNHNFQDFQNYDDSHDDDENNSFGVDKHFDEFQRSKTIDIYSTEVDIDPTAFSYRFFGPRQSSDKKSKTSKKPSFLDVAIQNAARQGLEAMKMLYEKTNPELVRRKQILSANHPGARLSKFNAPHDDVIAEVERAAYAALEATKSFQKNYKRTTSELGRQATTTKFSFRRTALEGLCPPRLPPVCLPAAKRYRTHDGTCNNLKHPRWGSAQMPFNRFLPPEYGDGIDTVRTSIEGGGALSSARFVSLLVHGAREGEAPVTLILAQWGQLIDHDLTSTAQPRSINGSIPRCCGPNDFHPSCFPIKVPLDDPWLAPLKVRCLEFLRSAPAQRRDCIMSWREQTNQVTSYLDASPIYSSNARTSDNARVFRNGLLQFGRGNPNEDVCQKGAFSPNCIKSGDPRSNEQPGLLAMHHVWVGEHNRIANDLSFLNPHWSDEKIYQETRRIIGALFQHITYREFLPLVLGREVCRLFDLDLLNSGFYTGYDTHVNPSVANSFSAAAFRFGHSLIPNSYVRCDHGHNLIKNNVSLHEEFAHGDIGTRGSLHRLLRGLVNQRALQRDEFITPELTNHLFQTGSFPFGLDLAAINIQRGRDHGIPAYTAWREPCGLTPINDWDELSHVVGPESVRRMRHAYISVHDIDLFVGGIAERAVIGGLVGPTFACIIAQQFSNLRRGDRFWYENAGLENSFSAAQLHSIRQVSLAQVLCRSTGGGTFQPHIFIPHEAESNERQPCGVGQLAPIDLRPWKELDPFKNSATDLPFGILPPSDNDVTSQIPNQKEITNADILTLTDTNGQTNELSKPTIDVNEKDPKANSLLSNRIDFIPNGSTGFHRPPPSNHIPGHVNDKLDLINKRTTTIKPSPIINVQLINNKLDAKQHTFISTTSSPTKKPPTKRKAFVNNVAIELGRTATTTNKKPKSAVEQSRGLKMDLGDNKDTTFNINDNQNRTNNDAIDRQSKENQNKDLDLKPTLKQTKDNYKTNDLLQNSAKSTGDILILDDIEKLILYDRKKPHGSTTNENNKRLLCQTIRERLRKTTSNYIQGNKLETIQTICSYDIPTTSDDRLTDRRHLNGTNDKLSDINEQAKAKFFNKAETNNAPRKQNINIITGNDPNQAYEIEINIRKTNKNRKPGAPSSTSFVEDVSNNNNGHSSNGFTLNNGLQQSGRPLDENPFSYKPVQPIIPMLHYNSVQAKLPALQTTKPPKIYYVSDEDASDNTTPQPGFFDNFFPSITGTFSGLFSSIQNLNPNGMTTTEPNNLIVTPPNRRVDTTHSTGTGTLINGIIQDNSNHGQTIFFQPVLPSNIIFNQNNNKRPDYNNINVKPTLQNDNRPGYGFSSRPHQIDNNNWNSYIGNNAAYITTTQTNYIDTRITSRAPYYGRPSSNYRPAQQGHFPSSQVYTQNFDQRKPLNFRGGNLGATIEHKKFDEETVATANMPISIPDPKIATQHFGKTISTDQPTTDRTTHSVSDSDSYEDDSDDDYYDDTALNLDPTTERKINEQFDKDGYLRPEHTLPNLSTKEPIYRNQTLPPRNVNDNFVMPVLLTTTSTEQRTSNKHKKPTIQATDIASRSSLTDIKADSEQTNRGHIKDEVTSKLDQNKQRIMSFANDLQNDNNLPQSLPLPVLPELEVREETIDEFPRPMNLSKWRKRFTLQIH